MDNNYTNFFCFVVCFLWFINSVKAFKTKEKHYHLQQRQKLNGEIFSMF